MRKRLHLPPINDSNNTAQNQHQNNELLFSSTVDSEAEKIWKTVMKVNINCLKKVKSYGNFQEK